MIAHLQLMLSFLRNIHLPTATTRFTGRLFNTSKQILPKSFKLASKLHGAKNQQEMVESNKDTHDAKEDKDCS